MGEYCEEVAEYIIDFASSDWKIQLSNFRDRINKPYYFFRPSQALKQMRRELSGYEPGTTYEQIDLPWGLSIRVSPLDMIGGAIFRTGVYDLCVSEVLWRLLDKSETAVDAGANIGHMTSVMAKRVAGSGKVLSFEPHPQVFQELEFNVAQWINTPDIGRIQLHEIGLSNISGIASLHTTSEFVMNRGTASLEFSQDEDSQGHTVSICQLDDVLDNTSTIGVMKIDVEGHEFNLLKGANRLLSEHRIRDIVFEESNFYPSPVTDHLERMGYTIFSIEQSPFAVTVSAAQKKGDHYKFEAKSYLATIDPERAMDRLRKPGYQLMQTGGGEAKSPRLFPVVFTLLLMLTAFLLIQPKKQAP